MKQKIPILFFCILILGSCKKNKDTTPSCEEMDQYYYYLTTPDKQWLNFSQRDSFQFVDSSGNSLTYYKNYLTDSTLINCNHHQQYKYFEITGDSCPYVFRISIGETENGFTADLTTGTFSNLHYGCYSWFNFGDLSFQYNLDSLVTTNKTYHEVFSFHDTKRTVYFTKEDGIIAFVSNSIYWWQRP